MRYRTYIGSCSPAPLLQSSTQHLMSLFGHQILCAAGRLQLPGWMVILSVLAQGLCHCLQHRLQQPLSYNKQATELLRSLICAKSTFTHVSQPYKMSVPLPSLTHLCTFWLTLCTTSKLVPQGGSALKPLEELPLWAMFCSEFLSSANFRPPAGYASGICGQLSIWTNADSVCSAGCSGCLVLNVIV